MPRKGRGGKRVGQPGVAYANRSDLNASNPTGGTAGHMGTARPYNTGTKMPAPSQQGPNPMGGRMQGPPPGAVTPLSAPSSRPNEPLTAGLNGDQATILPEDPDEMIRALYRVSGLESLRELVERLPVRTGPMPQSGAPKGLMPMRGMPQGPEPSAMPQGAPIGPGVPEAPETMEGP